MNAGSTYKWSISEELYLSWVHPTVKLDASVIIWNFLVTSTTWCSWQWEWQSSADSTTCLSTLNMNAWESVCSPYPPGKSGSCSRSLSQVTLRPMEMITPTMKDSTTHTDSTTTSAITVTQMLRERERAMLWELCVSTYTCSNESPLKWEYGDNRRYVRVTD